MKNHRVFNLQIVKKCKLFDIQIKLFNDNIKTLLKYKYSIHNYIIQWL